jgi:hypothetical protein
MVRSARDALATCLLASAIIAARGASLAQTLPRLHVDALGMHADRSVAPVASAIHVTIHVHVRERVAALDNLVLPDLSNLQILGDERRMHGDANGTDYVEELTVVGLSPGTAHLTPAHLDAIDARNGKPTRFSSNDLTLRIVPETGAAAPADWGRLAWRAALMAGGLVAGVLVLIALLRMRYGRGRAPAPAPPPAPVALPRTPPRPALEAALARLRARRTRDEAFGARAALREYAGATDGETLDALLLRLDGTPPAVRAALRLAERAAFAPDARLQSGIDDVIAALETVLAS